AGYHGYYPHYFAELKKRNRELHKKEIAAYIDMHANSAVNVNLVGSPANRLKASIGNYTPMLRKWYHSLKYKKEPFVSEAFYNTYRKDSFRRTEQFDYVNHSLYHSTLKHGLQELLRYADRNSMAFSREVRLPFLYHELVEFLFTLPPHMKIKNGWTKWIMRETFTKELPQEIAWRKDKIGYEPPQKSWMEKDVMQERIVAAKSTLLSQGIINKNIAERPILPGEAGNFKNENWKQMMAATLFEEKNIS
ncbi:MAG: asparagine synthase C-terminal domain-containing protein, partial [Ferruginibacter sp.]|nr:asparagine synthase C-terminal domain-containing protein [Ferruginibacter sp.]